ncbi:MAG: Flp pilus assembly protein CpaB [Gemmatimonadales bacterium]
MRRTRPLLMLAVALASGGVAALLAMRYLRQQNATVLAPAKSGELVVAARPLLLGTVLGDGDVKTIEWTGNALPVGYATSKADVVGRGVMSPLQENEPLLDSKLAPKGAGGGLPVIIDPGKRALTMRVNDVSGVAGFVTPNTRVDVLFTIDDKVNTSEPSTRIIMQDVRALAAGQQIQPDKDGKPVSVGVVTFLVTPEQAETLTLASQQGSIQLALRNMLDTTLVKTYGTRTSALLGGAIGRPLPARRPVSRGSAAPAPAPQPSQTVIEVYRGGTRTLQKF